MRGRFPNNTHSDCRGYTMCLGGGGATGFTNYNLLCPDQFIYSHLESQCTNVTSYQCLHEHDCTQDGDYPNPASKDCKSYIACVKDLNNIISARLISCAPDTIFSDTEKGCINETLFKCNIVTEKPIVLQVPISNSSDGTDILPGNNAFGSTGRIFTTIASMTLAIIMY
ncbi:unnamed protein product, partial [Brenthis ino]